jgi:hypothetical protein
MGGRTCRLHPAAGRFVDLSIRRLVIAMQSPNPLPRSALLAELRVERSKRPRESLIKRCGLAPCLKRWLS